MADQITQALNEINHNLPTVEELTDDYGYEYDVLRAITNNALSVDQYRQLIAALEIRCHGCGLFIAGCQCWNDD